MSTLAKQIIPIIVGASILWCAQSRAAFVFGYDGASANQSGDYVLGNNFTLNTDVEVTELGVFEQDQPISGSISIGIYENSGSPGSWTLLGTIQTITSSANVDVADQTAYIPISPITLAPGLYSIVTATSSDYNSRSGPGGGVSDVTFDSFGNALTDGPYDIWQSGTTLTSSLAGMETTGPGTDYPGTLPVFGAGTLAVTVVPEPATLIAGASLLLPLGASSLRFLRKKKAWHSG